MFYAYDTKIKIKFIISLGLILVSSLSFHYVFADTLDDQIAINQAKLQQINQQISSYQQQIADTQNKSNSLKNEISIYDNQIASVQLSIEAKQTQIDNANLQIGQLQTLIEQKTQDIADNKQILGQLIVELNEYDDQYALTTTVGSSNLSDFLDQVQYTQSLQDKISQLVKTIEELKTQLQAQQHDLQVKLAQLQAYQDQLEVTKDSLTTVRSQKQQLLTATQGSEKNFQKLLASSQQQQADLQKEIENLDKQVAAKNGNKNIGTAKGALAWPIDGIITQGYGNTGFTSLGYDFHNGIDVAGPAGTPIYAAADGDVINTDHSNQDFGNWVALQSTITTSSGPQQIVTLYGHMQKFIIAQGQHLSQGDLIGYEGNTGNTTAKLYGPERGYHLHFGVYAAQGFSVSQGAYTKTYGAYKVPYGQTFNPLNFLPAK